MAVIKHQFIPYPPVHDFSAQNVNELVKFLSGFRSLREWRKHLCHRLEKGQALCADFRLSQFLPPDLVAHRPHGIALLVMNLEGLVIKHRISDQFYNHILYVHLKLRGKCREQFRHPGYFDD
jgi:hypothetical protein